MRNNKFLSYWLRCLFILGSNVANTICIIGSHPDWHRRQEEECGNTPIMYNNIPSEPRLLKAQLSLKTVRHKRPRDIKQET